MVAGLCAGQGDHPAITVDPGHLGAALGETPGEHPVAAADVEGGPQPGGTAPRMTDW